MAMHAQLYMRAERVARQTTRGRGHRGDRVRQRVLCGAPAVADVGECASRAHGAHKSIGDLAMLKTRAEL
jgi:hypothetical protein